METWNPERPGVMHSDSAPEQRSQPTLVGAWDSERLPNHVGVIMDGNGRWAQQRGLTRIHGHLQGERAMMEVIAGALRLGIPHLSLYGFSTENWNRTASEVNDLMEFSLAAVRRRAEALHRLGVRVLWVGQADGLPTEAVEALQAAEQLTSKNNRIVLHFMMNYGGRAELMDVMRRFAAACQSGAHNPADLNEDMVRELLRVPDVDLIWRTSGEQRLSNFMPWQSTYAEMVFTPTLWPDVTTEHFYAVVREYLGRERRFGVTAGELAEPLERVS